jgi:LysM repeat protein
MIKILILVGFSWFNDMPVDSIGIETINGKTFVIHKVDEKETLFAISKRYRTTVDAILQYNAGASAGLEIGQILKIPYTPANPKAVYRPADGIVHEVLPKETMFSISRKYGVTMDEIKQWNNLTDNTLSIGQQLTIKKKNVTSNPDQVTATRPDITAKRGLHTVAGQETMFSIAKKYNISVQQLKDWNHLENAELKIGQTLLVAQPAQVVAVTIKKPDTVKRVTTTTQTANTTVPPVVDVKKDPQPVKTETTVQPQTIKISESYKNGSEMIEAGVAELIEGTEGNRKYLALHRTAPIGTILKVRNEMNNREVFVRVMGKLPDTALTNKVIIRISKSAYDRLGAIDQRFRVEVTYYK